MRIKCNNCNLNEMFEAIQKILDEYNLELKNANIYLKFQRKKTSYELFDLDNFSPAFFELDLDSDYNQKIQELICIPYSILPNVTELFSQIDYWNRNAKLALANYISQEINTLSLTNKLNDDLFCDFNYDDIQEIGTKLMRMYNIMSLQSKEKIVHTSDQELLLVSNSNPRLSPLTPIQKKILTVLEQHTEIIRITKTETDYMSIWTYPMVQYKKVTSTIFDTYTYDDIGQIEDITLFEFEWTCRGDVLHTLQQKGYIEFDESKNIATLRDKSVY